MTSITEAPLRLLGSVETLDQHLAAHSRQPVLTGPELIGLLADAGLTGRGGAGFPAWRKLAAVADSGRATVVIANGAEGEPASGKDRMLLASRPHLVLDGLQLVARATGARRAYVYLPAGAAAALGAALAERRRAGLDAVPVEVRTAPDAFVAGEDSAVVAAVSGRAAVPADKRIRITDAGALVQNVETLAHIALIGRHGAAWFRSAGTADEPGTFLATVSGAVAAPGVVEAGYGVRLGDLIDAAGGATDLLQAVLVGGYHGGWVPAHPDLPVARASMAPYDAAPGAGVVIALPANACGLAETARIVGYLARQVAGQCGPCINGLPRLADTLAALAFSVPYGPSVLSGPSGPSGPSVPYGASGPSGPSVLSGPSELSGPFERHGIGSLAQRLRPGRVAQGSRPGLPAEVARLAALMTGRGACRHPDGTARLIRSALRAFDDDVAAHLAGRCLAREVRHGR
jgi:NADH:ubiquinone oxidoreductase subunit F (NADH-binding)